MAEISLRTINEECARHTEQYVMKAEIAYEAVLRLIAEVAAQL